MSLRIGSLKGLEGMESLEAAELLEDYRTSSRREHCSRADFAAGWRAAKLRFAQASREQKKQRLKAVV